MKNGNNIRMINYYFLGYKNSQANLLTYLL